MIRRVVLRRFKRFKEETFPLGGNIVLAGQNNSGKTTVLQALAAWALAFEQWKLLNDPNKHNGAYARKPLSRQSFNAVPLRSFNLLWNDRNYSGTIEIEVIAETGWTLCMELSSDSTEQIYVRPHKDTLRENVLRDSVNVAYVSSVDGLEIEEGAFHNPELIRTLLGRQRPGSILRNLLLEASRTERWDLLRQSVQRMFGVELLLPDTPGGFIVCEYRRPGQTFALDLLSAGSGFHQVLLLLACLHTRQGSVLLIDEPDAHLHVYLQDTIFSELRRVAAETNSQIILATHSEVIFRSVPPEQLVVMMGPPRKLTSVAERDQLARAMAMLEQVDIVQALDAPGILYLEGHTDLNLLRAWAIVLNHPAERFFDREPFWKPLIWERRDLGEGIKADDHYAALKLVRSDLTGIRLIDSDGLPKGFLPSTSAQTGVLNRLVWSRYETESYLVQPVALARFIDQHAGGGGAAAVLSFLTSEFDRFAGDGLGAPIAAAFIANPTQPAQIVQTYLGTIKARTTVINGILQEGGIHGMHYTEFDRIAAQMLPAEIDPEVIEKLNFIQQAFGL